MKHQYFYSSHFQYVKPKYILGHLNVSNWYVFHPFFFSECEKTDHSIQKEEVSAGGKKASCLRIIVESGHDHFVAIYRVKVNGQAVHG